MKFYCDCESVGLAGPTKTIQYAVDEGPVQIIPLYRGWEDDPITRDKLEEIWNMLSFTDTTFIGFNISFDMFKLYQVRHAHFGLPQNSVKRLPDPFMCKSLDLQVHAMRNSPLSPFAFRRGSKSVAVIRRIPVIAKDYVSNLVTEQLKKYIPKQDEFKITVSEHTVKDRPHLVSLSFNVSGGLKLKTLMIEYGLSTLKLDEVWPLPPKDIEKPWLPYWDDEVYEPYEEACERVMHDPRSKFWAYAQLDIIFTKILEAKLNFPKPDDKSECCHCVAFTRYWGFEMDKERLALSEKAYTRRLGEIENEIQGTNLRSPKQRLELLKPHFPILANTGKKVLEKLVDIPGVSPEGRRLAYAILDYGPANQRLNQVNKVKDCTTNRFHPDLRVMGTATGRMSGASGLNWQGIGQASLWFDDAKWLDTQEESEDTLLNETLNSEEEAAGEGQLIGIRSSLKTPFGGDFASFEVAIAAAVYQCPNLQAALDGGLDLHSDTVYRCHKISRNRGYSYANVRNAYKNGDPEITGWRKAMKAIVFGIFYFMGAQKAADSLGLTLEEAEEVLQLFYDRYPEIQTYRQDVERRFITADTENWTKDSVARMESEVIDLLGWKRSWKFEKDVATTLWELGHGRINCGVTGTVIRTIEKGEQQINQSIRSALLGSAIAIQAAVSRQAGNTPVQASGANLCTELMARLWVEQRIPMLCIHDELIMSAHPNFQVEKVQNTIKVWEAERRPLVPSLKFEYKNLQYWSDK